MRTHRIPVNAAKNRKHECQFCGLLVTPAKASEFCAGRPLPPPKKRR